MFSVALGVIAATGLAAAHDGSPFAASSTAFAFPTLSNRRQQSRLLPAKLHMVRPPTPKSTVAEIEAESELLRREIEELRKEAWRRLEDLNEKLTSASSSPSSSSTSIEPAIAKTPQAATSTEEGSFPAPVPIVFTDSKDKLPPKKTKHVKKIADLLDETRWKVNLSIGREPGTWMPAEWGKSGNRINLSFTAEFTPSQLHDRDDFLRGGYADAKVLRVVGDEIRLAPSVSEGERTYAAKGGGWQVARGAGPMGTDLLRFFVEVGEQIAHTGGDVYVPKGRVYCSCGYFPFKGDAVGDAASSLKEALAAELRMIEEEILGLQKKKEEINNPFNLDGIKISREIFRLNREAERMIGKLNSAMVTEPDKALLRFSNDGDVGLTKEGGVCCQVLRSYALEYHILGRFSIASAERD